MEFASGKDGEFAWDKPKKSAALTSEQQEILERRGNLSPEEIHKLAHKGKKADCHSDNIAEPDQAKLVQLNTLKAHGVEVNESGI
jgi:phosphomethylpyrimidine synthase